MDSEQNDQLKEMDAEALRARKELEQNLDLWSARAVAQWWTRWYLKAGHKRLGRALVDMAREAGRPQSHL
jgi:hypothetical protein